MRYTLLDKKMMALVTTSRWLRYYFQAHPAIELTDLPMRAAALGSLDLFGQMIKWATIHVEYDINFKPQTTIKGQVPVDLLNYLANNCSKFQMC